MPDIVTKVVDASAVVAVIFGEPSAQRIADRIRGCALVSSALLDFEVANTCLSKLRRQPAKRVDLLRAYQTREQLRIETMAVDHASVVALAELTGLTGYDASYLHLARTLGVELVPLDRQLAQAAEQAL
jgi:predicted nucleic acid-binding protein